MVPTQVTRREGDCNVDESPAVRQLRRFERSRRRDKRLVDKGDLRRSCGIPSALFNSSVVLIISTSESKKESGG